VFNVVVIGITHRPDMIDPAYRTIGEDDCPLRARVQSKDGHRHAPN
jgi:SpoVK/Ycf46/Vps4 family AAA+-type ATPase